VDHDRPLLLDAPLDERENFLAEPVDGDESLIRDRRVQHVVGAKRSLVLREVRTVGVEVPASHQTADPFDLLGLHELDPLIEAGFVVGGGVPAGTARAVHVLLLRGGGAESMGDLPSVVGRHHHPIPNCRAS
jgi:hypothetical protein